MMLRPSRRNRGVPPWMGVAVLIVYLTVPLASVAMKVDRPAFQRSRRSATCAPKYRIISDHSACLPRSSKVKEAGVNAEDKVIIVNEHNKYRSQVTPTAANMRKLSWNDEVAAIAQAWAENCEFSHDKNYKRYIYGRFSVGQNLAFSTGPRTWENVIQRWGEERLDFTYGGSSGRAVVGHYTQMVWATTVLVGCGYAKCGDTHYQVCNYAPSGNIGKTETPYKSGSSCEDCQGICSNNLCDCGGRVCLNGADTDLETCNCRCKENFYVPPDCGLNCTDIEDPKMACDFYFKQHGIESCSKFANVPQECPKMCKWCPAAGIGYTGTGKEPSGAGHERSNLCTLAVLLFICHIVLFLFV